MTKITSVHSQHEEERVGYGKPPKHSRFKKGQSGNPKGRRSAALQQFSGWENPIVKYLLDDMTVTIKGKKVKMPVLDALMQAAIRNALGGCTKSLKMLLDATGGFEALIEEQKRCANSADKAMIDYVWKVAQTWYGDTDAQLPSQPADNVQRDSRTGASGSPRKPMPTDVAGREG